VLNFFISFEIGLDPFLRRLQTISKAPALTLKSLLSV